MKISGWEPKLAVATDVLLSCEKFNNKEKPSTEQVGIAARAFYDFLLCGNHYKPQHKFDGDVTLVKASKLRKMAMTLPEDYGVGACITGKVTMHIVEGVHENFILGKGADTCAKIVNQVIN